MSVCLALPTNERARTLEPIAWQACCRFPPRLAPDNAQVFGAQVENVAGTPVMRVRPTGRAGFVLDLQQGAVVRVDAEAAREIALDAAPRIIGRPAKLVKSRRDRKRPVELLAACAAKGRCFVLLLTIPRRPISMFPA